MVRPLHLRLLQPAPVSKYGLTVFLALAQVLQQLHGLLPVLVICQQRMVGLLPMAWLRSSPWRVLFRRDMLLTSARAEKGGKLSSALFDGCCFVSLFVTGPCCFNAFTRW